MRIRISLLVTSACCGLAAADAAAQGAGEPRRAGVTLAGFVSDTTGAPIPQVAVSLEPIAGQDARQARSAADGRFTLENVVAGNRSIQLRRIGFEPYTVAVMVASDGVRPVPVEIILTAVPTALPEVRVEEPADPDPGLRLLAFREHMRVYRLGRFVQRAEIERRAPMYASELFRTIPGAMLRRSSGSGNTLRLRGCAPTIWLDGVRMPGAELDDVTRPQDIAGLEIYTSPGTIPPQYRSFGTSCGSVVVWTR